MRFPGYLTKEESNIIKGIAILIIMLHNYFHIIPPAPGENEFDFSTLNFERFKQLIIAEPFSIVRHCLAYFGHYGVQLFIFISGYGLTISNKNKEINFLKFMNSRVKKLYPALLLVVVALLVVIPLYEGEIKATTYKSLLLKFTLVHNFIPGEALSVTGPFWFFSLIVQLYVVFPFLMNVLKKFGSKSLLIIAVISLATTMIFNQYIIPYDLNLNFLFIGHLPVFCLGIYLASSPGIKFTPAIILFSSGIFIMGNEFEFLWYFSFLAFTIIMIAIIIVLFPILRRFKKIQTFFIYSGTISLYLFAVHGIARFPFEMVAEKYNQSLMTTFLSIVYLGGVYLLANLLKMGDTGIQKAI